MDNNYGTLYICATPIGNLKDITIRTLEMLQSCGYVAAEDTRRTIKLLNHYNINTKLISCHEHNEVKKAREIVGILKSGINVAYVSDAGTPGISDPGAHIISECYANNINVTACPGASAFVTAVVLSGYMLDSFLYAGFLPRDKNKRKKRLAELSSQNEAVIIYEAPHRINKTLAEVLEYFGNREIAVIREMTKIHEEVIRTTTEQAVYLYCDTAAKGEFVLIVNKGEAAINKAEFWSGLTVNEHVAYYEKQGITAMDAIKKAAKDRHTSKSEIYKQVKTQKNENSAINKETGDIICKM